MESGVKCRVESSPKAFRGDIWLAFIFDGFGCRGFALANPIYQLPWTTTLVRNFSDL